MRRLSVALLMSGLVLLSACSNRSTATDATPTKEALHDPSQVGPYAVGVTTVTFERPSTADGTPRRLETVIWYPREGGPEDADPVTDAAPLTVAGPFPIVVYSHGSGGKPLYQTFLTEHLASHGFIVVAPPHPGNTSDDCVLCGSESIIPSARERPSDVIFVLDEVVAMRGGADSLLGPIVDPDRTAIVGHSFGGWTAIYAAADEHFDAAVAQAPGQPDILVGRAPNIAIPVMIIGAGKDEIVPPDGVQRLYDALTGAAAKEYVSLPEGHHLSFVDRCLGCTDALTEGRGWELINRYTTAWLYVHVKGDGRYEEFLGPEPPDAVVLP